MAGVTMQLREYIEHFTQFADEPLSHNEKIEIGRKHLFDFDYPIFDENYKKVFETNFIRHFYMKEIGFETEGLFKFQLETWLNIHMPYYNKLFESELIKFNPLYNTEIDTTYKKENDRNLTEDTTNDRIDGRTIDVNEQSKTVTDDDSNIKNTTDETGNVSNNTTTQANSEISEGTSTTNNRERDTTNTSNKTNDDFNRHLESDTPDQRLSLTANDGQGMLSYASKITEDTDNKSENTENTGSETVTETGSSNTDQNIVTDSETSSNTDVTNNSNTNIDSERDINTTVDMERNTKDDYTRNDTGNRVETINGLEDYVAHNVGKIGAVSYSELLTEFRSTFLRIERDLFYEMRELFMLVYL